MPAIRSTLVLGNSAALIQSQARRISAERWARPLASRIASSKFSTPSEILVMPSALSVFTFGSESVPGSHSKVTSSASLQPKLSWIPATSRSSCFTDKNEGVPPPK
jgi:hypothetical protein